MQLLKRFAPSSWNPVDWLGGNRYALVAFTNATPQSITYCFRWGKTGVWKQSTLKPGETHWHSWRYMRVNENRSPVPQVKLAGPWQDDEGDVWNLKARAAPSQSVDFARMYRFIGQVDRGSFGLVAEEE